MKPLHLMTAHELGQLIHNREISVEELISSQFSQIDQVEDKIKAFITLNKEQALQKARELDNLLEDSTARPSPLFGMPIAIKDNLLTHGLKTTCGSKILADYIPPYDATVVEQLDRLGTVLIGKTNLDEFAMGSSTEKSAFHCTHNPWELARVPGGSSGGSAAAIAAGEAVIGIGSDTGGSVRQPASFCGVVGLKPSYGRLSRYGLIAFASSLDQIGIFTRDVRDCAQTLTYLAQDDPKDATTVRLEPEDFTKSLDCDVTGLKIGIPKEYFSLQIQPEVKQMVDNCVARLAKLGAIVDEVSLPHANLALPTYYIIAPAEASSNLSRFDGVRYGYRADAQGLSGMYTTTRSEGFGNEVKRRIMLGTYTLNAGYYDEYYLKAQKVRTLICEDYEQAFEKVDVIITPTTPTTAFKLGEHNSNPLAMYESDIFTVPANLAGIPAITIPIGLAKGLPVGMQIMGRRFAESTLLNIAFALEQELGVGPLPELSRTRVERWENYVKD